MSRFIKLVLAPALAVLLGFAARTLHADEKCGLVPPPKSCQVLAGVFQGKRPLPFNSLAGQGLRDDSLRLALRDAIALDDRPSAAPIEAGLRLEIGDPKIEDRSPEAYRLRVV